MATLSLMTHGAGCFWNRTMLCFPALLLALGLGAPGMLHAAPQNTSPSATRPVYGALDSTQINQIKGVSRAILAAKGSQQSSAEEQALLNELHNLAASVNQALQFTPSTSLSLSVSVIHRQGLIDVNPAKQISVAAPQKRDVYMTDEQYMKIWDALLTGKDGKPTRTGAMVQCYMDLLYLLYQRGTDVRLLRWDQITPEGILFKPTKTERSSGTKVLVPIGNDTRVVLKRLKGLSKMRSMYLIHTEHGQPYTGNGIGSLFRRAASRAGVQGVTLKDLRAKAATDAKKHGYKNDQLQTALAHTDGATMRDYLRSRDVPVSEVVMTIPKR